MVSEGWDVTWLGDQAGYLVGTDFPTWIGNSVIAGHTTLASGMDGPFSQLQELEYGDQIVIGAWGMRYIYEVREKDLVQPTDPSSFQHVDRAWLRLLPGAALGAPSLAMRRGGSYYPQCRERGGGAGLSRR